MNFTVKITGKAIVRQQEIGKINSTESLVLLEKAINESLSQKISQTISYFKVNFGIEALSFGSAAYLKDPIRYKGLIFGKSPLEVSNVDIDCKIKAKNYGTLPS